MTAPTPKSAPTPATKPVEDNSRTGPEDNVSKTTVQPTAKQGDMDADEIEAPKPARVRADDDKASATDRFNSMVAAYPVENDGRTIVIGYGGFRLSINDLREVAGLPVVL